MTRQYTTRSTLLRLHQWVPRVAVSEGVLKWPYTETARNAQTALGEVVTIGAVKDVCTALKISPPASSGAAAKQAAQATSAAVRQLAGILLELTEDLRPEGNPCKQTLLDLMGHGLPAKKSGEPNG